nr:hypothetical protein [Patescibacteria group bacterium]
IIAGATSSIDYLWTGSLTGDISNANSGNIGIGTETPSAGYKLDVNGNIISSGYIVNHDTTWGVNIQDNTPLTMGNGADYSLGTDGNKSYWSVGTSLGSATGITMDGSGNVGIGTVSPLSALEILGAKTNVGSFNDSMLTVFDTTSMTTNVGGGITFGGKYTTVGTYTRGASISSYKINDTTGDYSFGLQFNTRNNGNNIARAMTIDNLGNVGIGTTAPGYKLTVTDTSPRIQINGTTGDAGIFMAGDGNFWTIKSEDGNGATAGLIFYNDNAGSTPLYIKSDGNVGIGTTTPATKLHVVGGGEAIVRNDTMSLDDDYDLINKGYLDSAIPDIIASATSSLDYFWDGSVGGDIYNLNSGKVGLGTDSPSSLLTIANDNWISAISGDGTASVNMFKVNTNNQIEVGAPLLIGPLEFAADSGLISFIDMPVTSASVSGTPHGYSLKLDGNNMLSVYGQSNGTGGIQNSSVGIGVATPQYGKLEVRNTLGDADTGISLYAGTGTSARSWLGSGDQWHLSRGVSSSTGITILNSGYTGILETNPSSPLEVGGHARNATDSYTGNGYELVNVNYLNTLTYWEVGASGIENTNTSGHVGINGPASSSAALKVNGITESNGMILNAPLSMAGEGVDANITGVNKLTAYTIDPLYNIEGINYSTYASAIVGGVKEEYLGKLNLDEKVIIDGEEQYEGVIDFSDVKKGSDAWVWYQVVDFSKEHVDISFIPYGDFASVYYVMSDEKIIFRADREAEISFRITGSRYDWKKWPTLAVDQSEKGWEVNRD